MKSLEEMTGLERSAALMIAIGADAASSILKYLDEDIVNKIAIEISKIGEISPEDKEDLIGDFIIETNKIKNTVVDGENVAASILRAAFGEEKTSEILNKLTKKDLEKGFEYLGNIDSNILTNLIQNEHPQTITVALSYLPPEKSADILKNISPDLAKDIIKRMAKIDKVTPDAVMEISRVIRKKYENIKETDNVFDKTDGIKTLVNIMGQMNYTQEKQLLDHFEIRNPDLYKEIRENIFRFTNILTLSNQEIQLLIDEIHDDHVIVIALKGAEDEIKFKFLRNMSANRATDLLREFDKLGPLRLSEINDARNRIVSIMRSLNDNGVINVIKDKEKYVE